MIMIIVVIIIIWIPYLITLLPCYNGPLALCSAYWPSVLNGYTHITNLDMLLNEFPLFHYDRPFTTIKTPVSYWIWCSYLTGVAAAELTPVKCENYWDNSTGIFAKPKLFLTDTLTNGALVTPFLVLWLSPWISIGLPTMTYRWIQTRFVVNSIWIVATVQTTVGQR